MPPLGLLSTLVLPKQTSGSPQNLTVFSELGQEELSGDRAFLFYFISFHKHNEKTAC